MIRFFSRRSFALVVGCATAMSSGWVLAETRITKKADAAPSETVEMFAGMKRGQLEVKLIPKDSTQARVFIKNKTDKPLAVKLPQAFAAVHVMAQVGAAGGRGGMGMGMGGMGGQSMGGGMGGMGGGGMGGGGMGGGGGGGFFNVAPEKVGEIKVTCVCLEHGKPEPRSNMSYEIRPIESVTEIGAVQELCKLVGSGVVPQHVAQAAAWNLNNHMSWDQLAAKRIERADGDSYPYFSMEEVRMAVMVAGEATKLADKAAAEKASSGSALSTTSTSTSTSAPTPTR